MTASLTKGLAAYMANARHHALPDDVGELAALHLLDTIASIVACRDLQAGEVARRYASTSGVGPTPVLGTTDRASLLNATFASAIIAHGAEINDFCPSAFVQPGPSMVSTGLLVGADRGRSGAEVLRSIAAGYEVSCRLPKAIGNEVLRRKGIANHGLGSLFGTATTAAGLIGLDQTGAENLLAYCSQQAGSSWQWLLDVEHLEKSFVFGGMAVHNALQAALLVEAGFTGVPDSLDAPGGWLQSAILWGVDDPPIEDLVEGLGEKFQLDLVGYKRYPVGGPTQPVVEGVLNLLAARVAQGLDHGFAKVHIAMPGSSRTFARANMPALNIPYLVTVILTDGELDFVAAQSLDRMRHDTAVHQLMERVEVEHDPSQEQVPRTESATVTITWADDTTDSTHVAYVRGYPSHPMSSDDVVAKARELLGRHFDDDRVDTIVELALGIEQLDSVDPLIESFARP